MPIKVVALLLASGQSQRFKSEKSKLLHLLGDQSVLLRSLLAFERNSKIDRIVLVIDDELLRQFRRELNKMSIKKLKKTITGGDSRQQSVARGLKLIEDDELVLIHDGARPFVSQRIITDCAEALSDHQAVSTALEATDTIAEIGEKQHLKRILPRKTLTHIQTPQAFEAQLIKNAHARAAQDGKFDFTDDCALVLHYRLAPVFLIAGDPVNIKITHPSDLAMGMKLLEVSL